MGIAAVRDAFNAVASPAYNCTQALLGYDFAHDVQWQVLTFSGMDADGNPFSVTDRLLPGADVAAGARATAANLLSSSREKPPT